MSKKKGNAQAVYNSAGITLTDGDETGLFVDANGNLQSTLVVGSTDFWPVYNRRDLSDGILRVDPAGALMTNGAVTTDQGAGRANFTGASILNTPAQTATFVNGSQTVTGTGFNTLDLHYLDFIKLNADPSSAWAQISFIESDTSITLLTNYTGTGGTGTYNYSQVSSSTGTGQTISVASGQATMALGTTAAAQAYISKATNGGNPLQFLASLSVSQRIANQNIYVGIESTLTSPKQFARFNFQGTTNTQVITETGYNPTTTPTSSEMETNTVTFPAASTSATAHEYKIEQFFEKVLFYIDNVVVATHTKRIPHGMTEGSSFLDDGGTTIISCGIRGLNGTTPGGNTNAIIDYILVRSYGRIDTYQPALESLHIATTPSLTNVASSATTVSLLASNPSVKSRIIYNESTQILYLKYGTTASVTSYTTQVPANTLFEFPLPTYTGAVDGIWASANGNARITEVS